MEKVVKIISLHDRSTDYLYWMSKSPIERLETIEILRQRYISGNNDIRQGLQRVYRIIDKT